MHSSAKRARIPLPADPSGENKEPSFGAFRDLPEENSANLQVAENTRNKGESFLLTRNDKKVYSSRVPKTKDKLKIPARVAFELSPSERQIIQAAHDKHGIAKATDILRMALRRWAEAEGFKVAG